MMCRECQGSGFVGQADADCPQCGGAGWVQVAPSPPADDERERVLGELQSDARALDITDPPGGEG